MGSYRLECQYPECDKVYEAHNEYRHCCDHERSGHHGAALLRAVYENKQIEVRDKLPGIFRYADWIPTGPFYIDPPNPALGSPICFRSHELANRLGLKQLFISFAGFWPERGAAVITRSFKEFEAQASITRYLAAFHQARPMPLLVASAGNTAAGYNLLAHQLEMPIYLVLPEAGLDKLVVPFVTQPFVAIVRGDYSDAISLANAVRTHTGLFRDGGVRNVARRAGMSVAMLQAVADPACGTGATFDHYFQAVGSAAGAIAAWEAVELLIQDGRFGGTRTRIHMAQNEPFAPIPDSWESGDGRLVMPDEEETKRRIAATTAQVLTNRRPPYEAAGGIHDVLTRSSGMTWRVSNYDVFQAARAFKQTEGVDIGEASAVAVGALKQAVATGAVKTEDRILLHITGGGLELQYSEGPQYTPTVNVYVEPDDVETVCDAIGNVPPLDNPTERLKRYD